MDNKEIKMQLLKEFGIASEKETVDFCREAYKFIVEENPAESKQVDFSQTHVSKDTTPAEVTAIDLGLPSGTLWADRNIGAKSPYEDGAFFSWGNVEPHFPKNKIDWGDEDDAFDDKFIEEEYEKTPGSKLTGNIDAKHDAATINLGEPWSMPTDEDFKELTENCEWERKTINGVNGYLVTSKINGSRVFFSCSGYGYGTSRDGRGAYGGYWSSTFNGARGARVLYFYSGGVRPQGSNSRYFGFAVRAVQKLSSRQQ